MKSWEIVGYAFSADTYCPEHIGDAVTARPAYDGWRLVGVHRQMPAEQDLDEIAAAFGIDRYDEHSFDSGDFPKVIFADQVHDGCSADNGYEPGQCGDRCATCHEPLGFDCPNTEREGD